MGLCSERVKFGYDNINFNFIVYVPHNTCVAQCRFSHSKLRFAQSFLKLWMVYLRGTHGKNMWEQTTAQEASIHTTNTQHPKFLGGLHQFHARYQTWAAIRGEGRDGSEYEDPEGIDEGGAHDSWVSQFSKRFATDPVNISGTGRDGSSTDTEGGDEGDGGSFATGEY